MTKHSNVFQRNDRYTQIFTEITLRKRKINGDTGIKNEEVSRISKKISKIQLNAPKKMERGAKYKLDYTTGRTNEHHYERIVRTFIIKIDEEKELVIKDFYTDYPLTIDDAQKADIFGKENFRKTKEMEKKAIEEEKTEKSVHISKNENLPNLGENFKNVVVEAN